MRALRIGDRRQQVDGAARPVHQGGAAERDAGVEKTLMLAIKCCAPDYVAEAQGLPDLRTFPSNLRNIIFAGQSAFRNAITPLSCFHGRSVAGSPASHTAIALAFISRSISA